MRNCAGLEGAASYLEQSATNQVNKLNGLKALAAQANAGAELGRYEFSGAKIFKTRQALLDVCYRVTRGRGQVSIAERSLASLTNLIEVEVSTEIMEIERKFSASEGVGLSYDNAIRNPATEYFSNLGPLTSKASSDLRNFYKLKILTIELSGLGSQLASAKRPFDLQRMRQGYWAKLESIERVMRLTRSHFAVAERLDEFQRLWALIQSAKEVSHSGQDSIFNAQSSIVQNEVMKQALVTRLQREQGQYSVALLNIMDVAQRINRNAQLRTEKQSNIASWEIAMGVSASATLLLICGFYFRRAVTTPLEMLTSNVSALALDDNRDGEVIDPLLFYRRDEIGDLAKQFATTFQALSKARSELQEASRAAVSLQRDRLHGAVENMPQGLFMLDREGNIILANRRLHEFYHLGDDINLVGMPVGQFIGLCRQNGAGIKRTISDIMQDTGARSAPEQQHSQRMVELDDGRIMTMTVMRLPDGGHVVTHEDITEKQAASEKIAHMAMHDALTNLANRTLFRSHIVAQNLDADGAAETALLFLDLDRFKIVNDTLGHPVGDALLVQVADRLRSVLGGNCFAARLGGDEFAIFQSAAAQPAGAERLANSIIDAINQPFDVGGHQIVIGTSVGIAIAPRDGVDADELAKNADLALYCAKQEGRGKFAFFETDMDRKMRDWREMEHDLREAIAAQQFELYYQPLVMLDDEKITGFEALVRWRHPTRGFISPADFIPIAEETGLITELGAWILDAACQMAATLPEDVIVAINISPLQFGSGSLPLVVMSAMEKAGVSSKRIMLEITEGVFLNDTDKTMAVLNELKAMGIGFAMDDFGTGYSSLSYIRKFPFRKIKIDQSFVRGMGADPESLAIIKAVINLCHDLGMVTMAEGVETAEQAETLRGLGCGMAQGYYFGRPMPVKDTLALFDDGKRKYA